MSDNSKDISHEVVLAAKWMKNQQILQKRITTKKSSVALDTTLAIYASEVNEKAMDLLHRSAEFFSDNPPDKNWFRDYYLLTGDHMILGEEGWEPASAREIYLAEDPNWKPYGEVNAPPSEHTDRG